MATFRICLLYECMEWSEARQYAIAWTICCVYKYFIVGIHHADLGCYINRSLVSCVLHANDIIFSASLSVLEKCLTLLLQLRNLCC